MSLFSVLNKDIRRCTRLIFTSSVRKVQKNEPNNTFSANYDSIDDFTSQLLQRKVNKWSARKSIKITENKLSLQQSSYEIKFEDISCLSEEKLNQLFQTAIDNIDNRKVLELIKQCIKLKKCPSLSYVFLSLSLSSQNGDKTTIEEIRQLCEELCPEVLEDNANFQHYVAEAVWVKGNINDSLIIFRNIYTNKAHLRRTIRQMLKFLIINTVSNRSEVALVSIIQFSEDLERNYRDFYPLTYVWQVCFLSEWFSDQCIAFDLLTKHNGLREAVISRIPYVVAISLQRHKTEVVHRLLEILLHFEMKSEYGGVLLALLDYQIRQGNTARCLEIVQWSLENDVQLPPAYHKNFVSLLLGSGPESDSIISTTKAPTVATHFKF